MRVGVIAKKLGMSMVFDQNGNKLPVTLLKIDHCQVVDHKTQDKHGYNAIQVGASPVSKISKPLKGFYTKQKVDLKRKLAEFRVSKEALVDIGTEIKANHYVPNQFIDITGISIGKGFAGVMKRHNFGGLRASHGVSVSHRSHGSTGQRQDPGKVFKGKKMAGHMGATKITVQNLRVVSVNEQDNILIVHGAVPGPENSYLLVRDAKKRALPAEAPYPCLYPISAAVEANTEIEINEEKS